MSSSSPLVDAYLEAYQHAYPGEQMPALTHHDGWFFLKAKGEHESKLRAEDLQSRLSDLVKIVEAREHDLESIAGIAAASDQVHKAATLYRQKFLQPKINACKTLDELRTLKNEICLQCENKQGFLVPLPAEFDLAFMMKFSELRTPHTA
jgi:hypothetical protein